MIDRSKAFWAWVWDNRKENKVKRLVIDSNNGEWVVVIVKGDEDDFFNMRCYDTEYHYHHERIPEPKKRLMTREEVLGFITWNPHIVVRLQEKDPLISSRYTYIQNIEMYEWAPITEAGKIGEWNKFYITEVEE
jgi:hypothetical protein